MFFQLHLLRHVEYIDPHYQWKLIVEDPDDDKFVDCAVAANADYIISNDRHFRVLEEINFPKVEVLSIREFAELLGYF